MFSFTKVVINYVTFSCKKTGLNVTLEPLLTFIFIKLFFPTSENSNPSSEATFFVFITQPPINLIFFSLFSYYHTTKNRNNSKLLDQVLKFYSKDYLTFYWQRIRERKKK